MARRARSSEPAVVAVQAYGPEPIGATQIDTLDAYQGGQLGGGSVLVAEGLRGQDDASSALYESPQAFLRVGALATTTVSNEASNENNGVPGSVLPPAWSGS